MIAKYINHFSSLPMFTPIDYYIIRNTNGLLLNYCTECFFFFFTFGPPADAPVGRLSRMYLVIAQGHGVGHASPIEAAEQSFY